jgi:hypothetical protein
MAETISRSIRGMSAMSTRVALKFFTPICSELVVMDKWREENGSIGPENGGSRL